MLDSDKELFRQIFNIDEKETFNTSTLKEYFPEFANKYAEKAQSVEKQNHGDTDVDIRKK